MILAHKCKDEQYISLLANSLSKGIFHSVKWALGLSELHKYLESSMLRYFGPQFEETRVSFNMWMLSAMSGKYMKNCSPCLSMLLCVGGFPKVLRRVKIIQWLLSIDVCNKSPISPDSLYLLQRFLFVFNLITLFTFSYFFSLKKSASVYYFDAVSILCLEWISRSKLGSASTNYSHITFLLQSLGIDIHNFDGCFFLLNFLHGGIKLTISTLGSKSTMVW